MKHYTQYTEYNGNIFYPGVIVHEGVTLGSNNIFHSGVIIGAPGESRDSHENHGLWIGDFNEFREYTILSGGTKYPTKIGNNNYVLGHVIIGHDCEVDDNVTIASGTKIGGFSAVREHATIGLNCSIHQGSYIGRGAMIGMSSAVKGNIGDFRKAYGIPAKVHDWNYRKMEELGYELNGNDVL